MCGPSAQQDATLATLAEVLAGAVSSCQALDKDQLQQLERVLPGVRALAITLAVHDEHLLQTTFQLLPTLASSLEKPRESSSFGRTAIFATSERTLASKVFSAGRGIVCPAK